MQTELTEAAKILAGRAKMLREHLPATGPVGDEYLRILQTLALIAAAAKK
jgi:hypothetical protein